MQAARGTSITGQTPQTPTHRTAFYRWLFALVAVAGVATDILTKRLVVARLDPESPVRLLGGLLTLRLIRNPGAAFSLGERFTVVFAVLSACVLVFVVVRLAPRLGHPGWAVALGLLVAGVGGNLTDRIFRAPGVLRGHVVDFLQLPHWPIFNVADMCITSAAVLIMVLSVIKNVGISGERYVKETPPAAPVAEPEPRE
ncbi:MAG: signal peptidase II [Propionibacteriaceae bacterium]